jgi:hypothetical protein
MEYIHYITLDFIRAHDALDKNKVGFNVELAPSRRDSEWYMNGLRRAVRCRWELNPTSPLLWMPMDGFETQTAGAMVCDSHHVPSTERRASCRGVVVAHRRTWLRYLSESRSLTRIF